MKNPRADAALFEKHMQFELMNEQNLLMTMCLDMALTTIQIEHNNITAGGLDFLVDDNYIIPDDRKQIFKIGFALGLNGDYYSAIHLLVPQIENLFRELVKLCGGLVTKLTDMHIEEWNSMSYIFNSPELVDCYDEDILFIFKGLLIEDVGANLRNKVAHGMISSAEGNGSLARYFLVATLKLCSWYSNSSRAILSKLVPDMNNTLASAFVSKK